MKLAEVAVMQQERNGLTAAAGPPLIPPREWFEMPEPDEPTGWTVTADGQVYGHAALWGTCHTGKPGRCVTPPQSRSDYAFYKTGLTETDDGELIPTGRITLGTGHASLTASPAATAEHYDNTGSVVADVNVQDGQHGIWVSGALRPNVTPDRIRELRGASLSGDWRNIRGALEMLGLLAVNVPGFPVPQAMAASGEEDEVLALVAAGTFERQELYRETLAAAEPSEAEWEGAIEDLTAAAGKSSRYMGKRAKVKEVMREFKAGKLKSSSGNKVTNRKQAVAIALSEAKMTASADDLAEIALTAAFVFDESKHPRKPKGSKGGGQWTVKELREGLESGELSSQDVLDIVSPGIEPGTGPLAQPAMTRTESEAPGPDFSKARLDAIHRRENEAYTAEEKAAVNADRAAWRADVSAAMKERGIKRTSRGDYVDWFDADGKRVGSIGKNSMGRFGVMWVGSAGDQKFSGSKGHVQRQVEAALLGRTPDASSRDYAPLEPLPPANPEAERRVIRNRRTSDPGFAADAYEGEKQDLLDAGWQIRDEGDGWCLLEDPDTGNVQLVSDQEPDDTEPDNDEDELTGSEDEKLYAAGSFDETKHPRHKKGSKAGGQFAAKGGGGDVGEEEMRQSSKMRGEQEGSDEDQKAYLQLADKVKDWSDDKLEALFISARDGIERRSSGRGLAGQSDPDTPERRKAIANMQRELSVYRAEMDRRKRTASGEPEPCADCSDPMSLPAARSVEVRELEGGQILAASFTQEQRKKLAKQGKARPDLSFPIRNRTDLRNAISSVGRASDPDAARRWIIKRARALKAVDMLPAAWNITASATPEEEIAAAGTFTETLHPRHPKGDKRGGEFAPKGTSKVAPRSDETGDPRHGGKMIFGPGGRAMSRTEATVLMDKAEGRYVKSHSETKPGSTPETALSPAGAVKRLGGATGADIARLEGGERPPATEAQIKKAAATLRPGVSLNGVQNLYRLNAADAAEVLRRARERHIKEGLVRIETDKYDI